MRRPDAIRGTLVLALLLAGGCSSFTVTSDYDTDYDFSKLRTFAWMADAEMPVVDATVQKGFLGKRIKSATEDVLAEKGYRKVASNPDFLLGYFVVVRERTDVQDWGYPHGIGYGRWYGGYGSRLTVHTYQQGSIAVDVIDARKKELVWRGVASTVVGEKSASEENVRAGIAKLLALFPPRK